MGDVLIAQAANHLQSVAVLDLYVREPVAPGRVVKFADATGLELAQQREDIARRIDDLHDKISAWEREKSVSAADLAGAPARPREARSAARRARREGAARRRGASSATR